MLERASVWTTTEYVQNAHFKHLIRVYVYTLIPCLCHLQVCLHERKFFSLRIRGFKDLFWLREEKRAFLSNEQSLTECWRWSSCFQTAQESKLHHKHTPGGAIQDQLGWSRTGKSLGFIWRTFLFFSPLSLSLASFFLLREKLSFPLHHAVSRGCLSIGGSDGLMRIELPSDPFRSICRNILESVYSLGKVSGLCHRWESTPGLEL